MRRFDRPDEGDSHGTVVQLEMMPRFCEFHTSDSTLLTTKLLHAKTQDGRPASNIMDLRRLSMAFTEFKDEQNIRYLLQNAKLLEEFHFKLSVDLDQILLARFHGILSTIPRTLKALRLIVYCRSCSWWVVRIAWEHYGRLPLQHVGISI